MSKVSFRTVTLLLDFSFGFLAPGSGLVHKEPIEGVTKPNPIRSSNYLPLVCYILHGMKYAKEMVAVIRKSLAISEESMEEVGKCNHWPFWVLFMSSFADDWLESVVVVASLASVSINKPNSLPITKLGVYLRLSAMIFGQ